MSDLMTFPDTVEEFMEQYKVTDTEQVYSNGTEYVPIFRMKQWFEHLPTAEPRKGKWIYGEDDGQDGWFCSECGRFIPWDYDYYGLDNIDFIMDYKTCPFCDAKMITYTGAKMEESE